MIWELRHAFTIKLLLEVSGLARSTYYYYIKHRNDEDKYSEIKEQITNIFARIRSDMAIDGSPWNCTIADTGSIIKQSCG